MRFHSISLCTMAFVVGASASACEGPGASDQGFRETVEKLPSGVLLSVEISDPADGASFEPGDVEVHGFATIGEAVPVAQTNLIYLLDVSGSTSGLGGCGGDANGDGEFDTILDCELAALLEINERAVNYASVARVGVGAFGTYAAAAILDPLAVDKRLLTEPDADLDGNGQRDVEEVLRSIEYGRINLYDYFHVSLKTSYGAGLEALLPSLAAGEPLANLVVMVSDGKNNAAPWLPEILAKLPANTTVYTFAIGDQASCDGGDGNGSLREISDATGGTCTEVPTVSNLPKVLPELISVRLNQLQLTLDGQQVPIDSVAPALPLAGPAEVQWSTTVHDVAPGEHLLCATAFGGDALGVAEATECVTIRSGRDPIARCRDLVLVADDSCTASGSVDAGSHDPDGDPLECKIDPQGPYPIGTTPVLMTCSEPSGAMSACAATVEVVNGAAPQLVPAELELWPPNHKSHVFGPRDCFAGARKACAAPGSDAFAELSFELVRLTSDEHDNGLGDGNTCEDTIVILDAHNFEVRAERSGMHNGRVYTATYRVTDGLGDAREVECRVTAPQAHSKPAIDDGCMVCVDANPNDGDDCDGCPEVHEVCKQ